MCPKWILESLCRALIPYSILCTLSSCLLSTQFPVLAQQQYTNLSPKSEASESNLALPFHDQ